MLTIATATRHAAAPREGRRWRPRGGARQSTVADVWASIFFSLGLPETWTCAEVLAVPWMEDVAWRRASDDVAASTFTSSQARRLASRWALVAVFASSFLHV